MKVLEVKIGSHSINKAKFKDFLEGKLKDNFILREGEDGSTSIRSAKMNIKELPKGHPRIKELGRNFMFTEYLTKTQIDTLVSFLDKNNVQVSWDVPVSEWRVADREKTNEEF